MVSLGMKFWQNFLKNVEFFDSNELQNTWRNYTSTDITDGHPHSCILNFLDDKQNQLIFTKKKLFIRNSSRKIIFVVHSCLVKGKFFKCWSTFCVKVKAAKKQTLLSVLNVYKLSFCFFCDILLYRDDWIFLSYILNSFLDYTLKAKKQYSSGNLIYGGETGVKPSWTSLECMTCVGLKI